MRLVTIIATSARPDLLNRTLNSLAQCEFPAIYKETIIIENGPPAGAKEIAQSAPSILRSRYMHVATRNKSAATNAALKTVPDSLAFFTDDDVRFAPTILSAYAEAAQQNGCNHFFGGPTSADCDAPPPDWLREYLPISVIGWERGPQHNAEQHPGKLMKYLGFNWAAFASDILAAGGFNPDFGPGSPTGSTGQETEMQLRMLNRGLTPTYVPEARVWHYIPKHRCTPEWAIDRVYRNGVQDGLLEQKNNPKFRIVPPRRIATRYLKGIIRACVWSLSPNPELRFKAKFRRSYDRGLLHGFQSQNRITAKPPSAPPSGFQTRKVPLLHAHRSKPSELAP